MKKILPGLTKSERPKSISFKSESSRLDVNRKFCLDKVTVEFSNKGVLVVEVYRGGLREDRTSGFKSRWTTPWR